MLLTACVDAESISFIPLVSDDDTLTSPRLDHSGAHSGEPELVIERMSIEESLIAVPRENRICMVLLYIEGLKYREIADILGISEEAVRKRVARGNQKFKEAFGRDSEGDQ